MVERGCDVCGKNFDDGQLPGIEDTRPYGDRCDDCKPRMLRVNVSCLGKLSGAYVLDDAGLRWEPVEGREGMPEPVEPKRPGGPRLILGEDRPNTWIAQEDDPERWLRRLPGFYAMRGHMTAEIVQDTRRWPR